MTESALMAAEAAELAGRRWIFGPADLDERSLELRVNGERVDLERKPLEMLLYLLHHAGEAVTKEDLAENLWPGRILTESVLSRHVSVLRQALKDDDRTLIRTVHGYGYRLVAQVRVEAAAAAAAPAFDFEAGDNPPTRPQWRLVERLGAGGHGEAWLAQHQKTGDARVFKFAVDAGALSSLKREITLYRLLHDSLGARAPVARILEWNLEEPPYFIEMEHVAGGNLQDWSEAQGGLPGMPLLARLELVAQVADALAAAHSVGALHKDLKPGNVLVCLENGRPVIRLCDFGSGSVLDPKRLDELGITRLGFTKALAQDSAATPLYLAPEVIAGQPFTMQADIYSLGILLYQMVTGDLRRALAPGWEADVEDELLREDIAVAAAGNPARRLTDASQLAERLRTLEQRRNVRAAEVSATARAERVRRIQEELRRMRVLVVLLVALTVAALAGGISAYRARDDAMEANATAKAVSDFLMEDVLRTDSGLFRPSETSYEALLNRAADEVDVRLKNQPAAAASVHSLLGRRYQDVGQFGAAMQQYERAAALFASVYGEAAESTLVALDRLAWIYVENGQPKKAVEMSGRLRALWETRLPPLGQAMLVVRIRSARTTLAGGAHDAAESELRAVLRDVAVSDSPTPLSMALLKQWVGVTPPEGAAARILEAYAQLLLGAGILEEFGDGHREAAAMLEASTNAFSTILGDSAELTALARLGLSVVLVNAGQYERAEALALRMQDFDDSLPAGHYARGLSKLALGRVRVEQRRHADAVALLSEAVGLCTHESGCPPRLRFELLFYLGRAYVEQGRGNLAVEFLRTSLDIGEQIWGPGHLYSLVARTCLADALRQTGALSEAATVLAEIEPRLITALRPYQQAKADLHRAEGLIFLQKGQRPEAIQALRQSLNILQRRLGTTHWRSVRVGQELESATEHSG